MEIARSVFTVRYGAMLMTAAVHGWLLYLLWQQHSQVIQREKPERRSTVWLLPLNLQPAPPSTLPKRDTTNTPATVELPGTELELELELEPESESTVITAPKQGTEQSSAPSIDWHEQAAISAKDLVSKLDAKPSHRALDGSDTTKTVQPKKRAAFEWRPNMQRFGLTPEGEPYIRLGERCVYVMFVIACGFGGAPAPNGELFDDMNDPNLERGSVPNTDQP